MQDYKFVEERVAGTIPIETVISFGREIREDLNFAQRLEVIRAIEQKLQQLPQISGTVSLADFHMPTEPIAENASLKEKVAFNNRAEELQAEVKKHANLHTYYSVAKKADEFSEASDELWRITSHTSLSSRLDGEALVAQIDSACRSVIKYHADTRHVVAG